MQKWFPICSPFVSVIRSRPPLPVDEIINSWGQSAPGLYRCVYGTRSDKSLQPC